MTTLKKVNTKEIFEKAIRATKLTPERTALLETIAQHIANEIKNTNKVNINFICTHNSRRSQFSQTWAYYAMEYFGIHNGFSFSSGTAVTAFHGNTVRALEACGFDFKIKEFNHQNPQYVISSGATSKTITGFSKLVEDVENQTPFIAITTCGNADENCPFIPTASQRIHLPYIDPKATDGTNEQDATYLATSKLIAGELGFLFKTVKGLL
ncbi:hypothetical protein N9901_03025 [Flavobacteriaceae bacterium]|nr:hypothetical protein [Flavobacteriaceae bacterium]